MNYVYNPNKVAVETLPVIYGFNNGGFDNNLEGVLMAEDGSFFGNHISSDEGFMIGDLGIEDGSHYRHETFKKYYPNGYRLVFVSRKHTSDHEGLQKALTRNREKAAGMLLMMHPEADGTEKEEPLPMEPKPRSRKV